jgi:predicted anti-sigma-YlaC factor YlaD
MTVRCGRSFDEALLTGYVDGVLTQADEQRVAIHLEDCEKCRTLVSQMQQMREVAMSSRFETPPDTSWDERPRGAFSFLSLGLGWMLILVWVVSILGFGLWQFFTGPENLLVKLLIFSGLSGFGLLLLSVLIDRLKVLGTDRYRRVQK